MPYLFTGIIKGKWKSEVEFLFIKHNINIDLNQRGFVKDSKRSSIAKIKTGLKSLFKILKNIVLEKIYIFKNERSFKL